MDDRLKKALDFSNYQNTLSNQRRILKEKLNSSLIYGFNGGIFKIDRELINFVNYLISMDRKSNVPLLDSNQNPIMVEDLEFFLDQITDIYFVSVFDYHTEYEKIKKNRSVEKLIDL